MDSTQGIKPTEQVITGRGDGSEGSAVQVQISIWRLWKLWTVLFYFFLNNLLIYLEGRFTEEGEKKEIMYLLIRYPKRRG